MNQQWYLVVIDRHVWSYQKIGLGLSGLFVNPIYLQQDCYVCSWLTSVVNKLILVRKDMDVNEHERLSNFTLRQTI
jgi:hypothetical protein